MERRGKYVCWIVCLTFGRYTKDTSSSRHTIMWLSAGVYRGTVQHFDTQWGQGMKGLCRIFEKPQVALPGERDCVVHAGRGVRYGR